MALSNVTFNEEMLTTGAFRNFNAPVSNGSQIENKAGRLKIKVTDLESNEL